MKLKLAKWCSIIPLFFHALLIAAVTLGETIPVYLFELVGSVSIVLPIFVMPFLAVFVMPFLAVLGFVFSLILIFQKERKAIKFLVLSFVEIIISVWLILLFLAVIVHNL